MVFRKIIITTGIITIVQLSLALFPSECYAKNYYSYCIYQIFGKTGKEFNMNVINKTFSENDCLASSNSNPKTMGKWVLLESDCITGDEYDRNFFAVFNNDPIMGVYLSYVNLDGFETRYTIFGVAGSDSPIPGLPVDIPVEMIMPLINAMKQNLESAGIKNINVVYPETKQGE